VQKKYTTVYKRGGHAPCSCDVTLKKDDGSVGVDNCSTLGGGNGVTSLFAPNSSPGEKIEGACMPCWDLQGTTVVGGKVREYRTNYKLISTENKLKL
jgi:hypothetical protein